jgi:hypothetical protein
VDAEATNIKTEYRTGKWQGGDVCGRLRCNALLAFVSSLFQEAGQVGRDGGDFQGKSPIEIINTLSRLNNGQCTEERFTCGIQLQRQSVLPALSMPWRQTAPPPSP